MMTTEMPAVTGGDVAAYMGQLVAQVAELEAQLAEKTAEADGYFEDLVTCARALTHIELAMSGEEPICVGCLLNCIEQELEEAEPGYAWAIGLVAEEMAAAEEDDFDDEDVVEDVVEDEAAEDAPAGEQRVIN